MPNTTQLPTDLQDRLLHSIQTNRPLIYHLTPDSSWLISFPLPKIASTSTSFPQSSRRSRYNTVIDPWLSGAQIDYYSWFSSQTHASPSAIPSISALEQLLEEIEKVSAAETREQDKDGPTQSIDNRHSTSASFIDAVVISHEFTDHCHKETLEQCHPSTPIYATTQAFATIRKWQHFTTILEIPELPTTTQGKLDWHNTALSAPSLPPWLGIARLVEERKKDLAGARLHAALMIVFDLQGQSKSEALIYTPHGIPASSSVINLLTSPQSHLNPPISFLALLHGLHEVYVGGPQINLGGFNGAALVQKLKIKYWIRTHDEIKNGSGLIGKVLSRKVVGWDEALGLDSNGDEKGSSGDGADGVKLKAGGAEDNNNEVVEFVKIGNGECMVLE